MEQTKQLKWYQKAVNWLLMDIKNWIVKAWYSIDTDKQWHLLFGLCIYLYLFQKTWWEHQAFWSLMIVLAVAVLKECFDYWIKPLYKKNYTPLFDWRDIAATVAIPYLISAISLVT